MNIAMLMFRDVDELLFLFEEKGLSPMNMGKKIVQLT